MDRQTDVNQKDLRRVMLRTASPLSKSIRMSVNQYSLPADTQKPQAATPLPTDLFHTSIEHQSLL